MTPFQQKIMEHVSAPEYKPLKPAGLARKLRITKKSLPEFRAAVEALAASGRIREDKRGLLRPRAEPGLVAGIVKRIASGAAYLIPHEKPPGLRDGDVYIASHDVRDAHTGDEVLVRLLKRRGPAGKQCGRVEEIIERATNTFVGTYFEEAGDGYVLVDGRVFAEPISVGDPGAKGARPDDKVVIEMLRFPMHQIAGEAVLTRVLGPRGEPGVDTQSIIHEFGLPDEFSEEVHAEAALQAEQFDPQALGGRLDLTKETIVTIDPADARDFDDAISLTRSPEGHWTLGVHVADVAHFVPPGTALDREAMDRGTSVYLPDRVIPMLPELISNGLASLQKGKVRVTKSVFIEFTPEGVPVHTEFANSAIRVTQRFAYEEVLPIVREPERFRTRVSAKVRALLARMHELAMLLRRRRFAAGALEMSLPEVKLEIDADGKVAGANEVEHDESHQIIEEFMLAANMAVATELTDRGIPFLRRTHGDPDLLKLKAFSEFAAALGYPLPKYQSRPDLQNLLDRVKDQPAERAVNYALLRSMKQAEYSGVEMGHYALAVENYCHFTSPIRRYPDLTVHRLVDAVLTTGKRPGGRGGARGAKGLHVPGEVELARMGKHCSATERRAAAAERELTKVKLLTFMAERIGEELDAVITGVERFGLFCQGIGIPAEGMVHISAVDPNDYFYHDPTTFSLIGGSSGREYRLGDLVRVSVAHVDVDRRELDFRIVAPKSGRAARRAKPPRGPSRPPKRRKTHPSSPRGEHLKDPPSDRRGRRR